MNNEDIIRMAQQTGWDFGWEMTVEHVCEFAALVAAAEREAIKWNSIHSCHADCQNPACVIVREAVEAEREECAKMCEEISDEEYYFGRQYADMLRARGDK